MTLLRLLPAAALLLAGCASAPASYHTLAAQPGSVTTTLATTRDILVGPSTLPAALDRPQLVLGGGNMPVVLAEQQRWLGDLGHTLDEVLAVNLSQRTGYRQFLVWPQPGSPERPLRLLDNVTTLRLQPGRGADLAADWRLIDSDTRQTLACGHHEGHYPVKGDSISELVAAQNILIARWCDDMATALADELAKENSHRDRRLKTPQNITR